MNNEDIKVLEEYVEEFNENKKKYKMVYSIGFGKYWTDFVQAIENLIAGYKDLEEYKKYAELTKISCCTAQNCEALNNAIRKGIIINKAIDYIEIDKELEECCGIIDVNGIELLKILRGEK